MENSDIEQDFDKFDPDNRRTKVSDLKMFHNQWVKKLFIIGKSQVH